MKTISLLRFAALSAVAVSSVLFAQSDSPRNSRIGVYDSRAVAFAYFWSPSATADRQKLMRDARAAKLSGDNARFAQLNTALVQLQKRNHLQVFSTAPVGEALASLGPRLPLLREELRVRRLISKWDEAALQAVPLEDRVDVTDRLVAEFFTPTPRQAKILAAMKTQPPLPLDDARRLAEDGKL